MTDSAISTAAGELFGALIGDQLCFCIDESDLSYTGGHSDFIYSSEDGDFLVSVAVDGRDSASAVTDGLIKVMIEDEDAHNKFEENTQVMSVPDSDVIALAIGPETALLKITHAKATVAEVTTWIAHALSTEDVLRPSRLTENGDGTFEYRYGLQDFLVTIEPAEHSELLTQLLLHNITEEFAATGAVEVAAADQIVLSEPDKTPVRLTIKETS